MAIIINATVRSTEATRKLEALVATLRKANAEVAKLNAGLAQTAAALGSVATAWKSPGRLTLPTQTTARASSGLGVRSGASSILDPLAGMKAYAPGAAAGNMGAAAQFNRFRLAFNAQQRSQTAAKDFLKGPQTSAGALLMDIISRTRFGHGGGFPLGRDIASLLNSPGGKDALDKIFAGNGMGPGKGSGASSGAASIVAKLAASRSASGVPPVIASGAAGAAGADVASAAAGAAAGLAPLALAAGVVVASLGAMAAAIAFSSKAMREWTQSAVRGGLAGSRAASVLGGALGVNVAGIGSGLMSGYGPIAAAGAGVNPLGGPFGDINYNQKGLKVLDWIRKARSFNEARRRAEMAGSPDAAGAYLLSGDTYSSLRNMQQGAGSMANMKKFAEFGAGMAVIMNAIKGLAITAVLPVIKPLADMFTELGTTLSKIPSYGVTGFVSAIMAPFIGWIKLIQGIAIAFGALMDWMNKLYDWIRRVLHIAGADHTDSARKATEQGTYDGVRRAMRDGTFGGGDRAVPSAPSLNPAFQPGGGWKTAAQGVL